MHKSEDVFLYQYSTGPAAEAAPFQVPQGPGLDLALDLGHVLIHLAGGGVSGAAGMQLFNPLFSLSCATLFER